MDAYYRDKKVVEGVFAAFFVLRPIDYENMQYRPVFRIPDTFQAFLYSIKMVLDPIYQAAFEP
jgi:hypothetical protein